MSEHEVEVLENTSEGDIIILKLAKPSGFEFRPGQYCMVKVDGLGKPLSIAVSPTENYLMFMTKNRGSDFKKKLASLKKGERVKLIGPAGSFVLNETENEVVMLSGGIGITPLKSMVEYAIAKKLGGSFTLIYSNSIPEEIPSPVLKESPVPNVKIVFTVTKPEISKVHWGGQTGRIDMSMIRKYCGMDLRKKTFYVCGPPAMVEAMVKMLEDAGVQKASVKMERFVGY